jgi:hypothetical protein
MFGLLSRSAMPSRLSHTWLPVVKNAIPAASISAIPVGLIPKPPAEFSAFATISSAR